jgi:hypothetical protein
LRRSSGRSPLARFQNWTVAEVPRQGRAVHTIWDEKLGFVHAGMWGRSTSAAGIGPWGRLNSHPSGRRSEDLSCIYICDRLVLSGLHIRLSEVAEGALALDTQARLFIRERLGFRVLAALGPDELRQFEPAPRKSDSDAGHPLLDPFLSGRTDKVRRPLSMWRRNLHTDVCT